MSGPEQGDEPPREQESRLQVRHEGRVAAEAHVRSSPEPHGTAKVALHPRHEVAAPEARRALVDQVLDVPGVSNSDDVHVVAALGDVDSITRLQERTQNFQARAAGSSSIIDAELARPAENDG